MDRKRQERIFDYRGMNGIVFLISFIVVTTLSCQPMVRGDEKRKTHPIEERKTHTIESFQSDQYGGWKAMKGKATGFFHVKQIDRNWWLVTPEGNVFLSIGVNIIRFSGDNAPSLGYSPYQKNVSKKYKNENDWQNVTLQRLESWGFNTKGAWSDDFRSSGKRFPYIIQLNFGSAGSTDWRERSFPDVFSPGFEKKLNDNISKAHNGELIKDPYLIGYILDNEILWGGKVIKDTLAGNYGERALIDFLKEKYKGNASAFSKAWGLHIKSFEDLKKLEKIDLKKFKPAKEEAAQVSEDLSQMLGLIARRFFKVTTEAIRSKDKNHLIMGVRFLSRTPKSVVEECGKFNDVITINYYPVKSDQPHGKDQKRDVFKSLFTDNWLEEYYRAGGKPILITETSFKAMDSGLPNKGGASVAVSSQKDRTELFEWFLKGVAEKPYIVGYHWFQYADQPKQGRFDGESNNFGLVDINDTPYQLLTQKMSLLNREFYRMRIQ